MIKTTKKPVKNIIPSQDEWKKFEGAMDEILKAPPQPKFRKKITTKKKK